MRRHRLLLRFGPSACVLVACALVGDGRVDLLVRLIASVAIPQKTGQIPVLGANVLRTYPHDPRAFTQGLEYYGGDPYENTGNAGPSTPRKDALETRDGVQKVSLPRQ